ncbi:hypothetical protein HBH61_177660 [Parastagonospora nodorum]|nr:hypothetical protein HBH61_177660 [Parastagonospora nodorum]
MTMAGGFSAIVSVMLPSGISSWANTSYKHDWAQKLCVECCMLHGTIVSSLTGALLLQRCNIATWSCIIASLISHKRVDDGWVHSAAEVPSSAGIDNAVLLWLSRSCVHDAASLAAHAAVGESLRDEI